jgi:hypothetical protein
MLMLPARLAQALAPWLFGLLLAALGTRVLWVSGGLALSAMVALLFIHVPARRDSPPVLTPSEETACGAGRCAPGWPWTMLCVVHRCRELEGKSSY